MHTGLFCLSISIYAYFIICINTMGCVTLTMFKFDKPTWLLIAIYAVLYIGGLILTRL